MPKLHILNLIVGASSSVIGHKGAFKPHLGVIARKQYVWALLTPLTACEVIIITNMLTLYVYVHNEG